MMTEFQNYSDYIKRYSNRKEKILDKLSIHKINATKFLIESEYEYYKRLGEIYDISILVINAQELRYILENNSGISKLIDNLNFGILRNFNKKNFALELKKFVKSYKAEFDRTGANLTVPSDGYWLLEFLNSNDRLEIAGYICVDKVNMQNNVTRLLNEASKKRDYKYSEHFKKYLETLENDYYIKATDIESQNYASQSKRFFIFPKYRLHGFGELLRFASEIVNTHILFPDKDQTYEMIEARSGVINYKGQIDRNMVCEMYTKQGFDVMIHDKNPVVWKQNPYTNLLMLRKVNLNTIRNSLNVCAI